MKALRKLRRGVGQIELVEIPMPIPGYGEVIVRVACAGVCGTDIHIFHDAYTNLTPPVTLGHEFTGIVSQIGPGVKRWAVGDRVVVESLAAVCGTCTFCRSGQTQLCRDRKAFGISQDGGFAQFVAVREDALHLLPEGLSFEQAAMTEPLCVAVHAVMERSRLPAGAWVLVTGPGTIGQLVCQVARLTGASVILAGTSADHNRLEVAKATGVEHCLFSDQEGAAVEVVRLTRGGGPDVAFECAGARGAVHFCLNTVRKGGQIVQVGLSGRAFEIDYDLICLKEIEVLGSFTHNRDTWEKSIALLTNPRLDLSALVSGVYPLEKWDQAFEKTEKAEGLKYLLTPHC